MAFIGEYRIIWNGGPGGTGYTVFHTGEPLTQVAAQSISDAIEDWLTQVRVVMASGVSGTMDTEVRVLDEVTGALQRTYQVTNAGAFPGSGGAEYAAGVGTAITWDTGTIVGGRRLRGRTFIVPLAEGVYDGDGTVAAAFTANVLGPSDVLRATGHIHVWSRKNGIAYAATSVSGANKVSWLQSRKR